MARKSRKPNNKVEIPNLKPSLIQVAAYVRLSLEDRAQKGNSIENQQRIISSYIEEHSDFELYDTYIDSGVSGTTFERPGFQRMLHDAEGGKIGCIMVKDLSRLGRSVIDTGYYAEKVFPGLGVRIISITDNYDSDDNTKGNSITLPLINVVNEAYVLDISRKTRSQSRQAMKDGVYVGGQPLFGYIRSSDNCRKLIVDAPAAEIVSQIFTWAVAGVSVHEIARRLNVSKIPSPNAYKKIKTSKTSSTASGLWYAGTVERILINEIYLGRLVQGKTKSINFDRQPAPIDEWVMVSDAHEAIVSVELFGAAHLAKNINSQAKMPKRVRASHNPDIYKGKIYCAHCGRPLERTKSFDNYVYRCVTNRISPGSCSGNQIYENAVKDAVLTQLLQYQETLVNDLNAPSAESEVFPELRFIEMELSRVQEITRSLYENLINGILDKNEYTELRSHYQGSMDSLLKRSDELKQKLNDEKRKKTALQKSLRILDELAVTKIPKIEHLDRFVERIELFRDGRVYVMLSYEPK